MKKYWKIIITLCVITLTGMRLYEYFRGLKEQFTDVVGEPIEYDEEKADPVYSGSYTFDGKEIQFFLDNYYGLPESYVIKDGKEINISNLDGKHIGERIQEGYGELSVYELPKNYKKEFIDINIKRIDIWYYICVKYKKGRFY